MTLDDLLKDNPRFHDQGTACHGLTPQALKALFRVLEPGRRTLETGVGASTVVFALAGTLHTAIVPDEDEIRRITDYCAKRGVPVTDVEFVRARSQDVLWSLPRGDLDLVLIDGSHGFPIPFIDWYATAPMLRVGGLVFVDDTHLWTGFVLRRFLIHDRHWDHVADIRRRLAVFRKVAEPPANPRWTRQPYVVRKSRLLMAASRLLDLADRARGRGRREL